MTPIRDRWESEGGEAILLLGNCLEILPTLSGIDAVVTDPMYGINGSSGTIGKHRGKAQYHDGIVDDLEAVRSVCVPAVKACIAMARSVLLTPGMPHAFEYPKPAALGFIDQPASVGLSRWGACTCQPVLFYGDDPRLGKDIGRLTYRTVEPASCNEHPCAKPIGVAQWMVQRASLWNETVLDPFMGSGTTGVACLRFGRKFIGIEIEPKYFAIARKRIEEELNRFPLFEEPRPTQGNLFQESA